MKRISGRSAFIALLVVALYSGCENLSESEIKQQYKNASVYNETAAFLAGLPIPAGSPLFQLTQSQEYFQYRSQIDQIWGKYNDFQLKQIRGWSSKNLTRKKSDVLFYPFSGPDILNAVTFFPDVREIIMIGLEQPGQIPDPRTMSRMNVFSGLWNMKKAMRTLLQLNLFRTQEMQVDFRTDSFNSVAGIMMFFLSRCGYEILDMKKIAIGKGGNLSYGELGGANPAGLEVVFRKGKGHPLQIARFFRVDLSDNGLKGMPHFMEYLKKYEKFNTMLKSASYLLSYDYFDTLRSFVLSNSKKVLQDDSGIPYRFFEQKNWRINYYGYYRVLEMFSRKFQPDFDAAFKKQSTGLLPFSYGYGFVPNRSHVIVAEKL